MFFLEVFKLKLDIFLDIEESVVEFSRGFSRRNDFR